MTEPEPMTLDDVVRTTHELNLALSLEEIERIDPSNQPFVADQRERTPVEAAELEAAYARRYLLVMDAVAHAAALGFAAGFALDPADPAGWVLAYIELPTGQVSWHQPAFSGRYDGHSTPEKYDRIRAYLADPWSVQGQGDPDPGRPA